MIKRFCDFCYKELTERDYSIQARHWYGLSYNENIDLCFNCAMERRKQQEEMYKKLKELEQSEV